MQTTFSLARLADPDIAVADKILRACVHCGFCQATCPTYVLLGDELDSPRGRIYLIKEMLEHDRAASQEVVTHIDRCLSCLACMTTCPSGVHYMHLVDHARAHIEETYTRPLLDRLMRSFLAHVMPHPRRLRLAMMAGILGKPFAPLFAAIGLKPLAAAARLAPLRPPGALTEPGVYPANGPRKGRVALLAGCANEALAPSITEATIRLLNRHGVEVVIAPDAGCCGSLEHHLGREEGAFAKARANIDAWSREIEGEGLDAILITISGCGTTVKDYGFMLRTDPVHAARAAKVSSLARDISEYLATLGIGPPAAPSGLTVAFHSACSLQHGQRVHAGPRDLLTACGFVVKEIPEAHLCCGSAGTYNILQPDIAGRLRDRKIANIDTTAPDVIAAGNIGCIAQIASGTAIPVVHPVELIDWATGGPVPDRLKGRVT
ncbi:MAG: glycolate oxidase iron-sulfur subunit [Alphaproteobacteria bacterium]|nr:glycolate oxidase iron-sulfur subunit [Alphaproteobacteria bacterium]